nr:TnsA endonuclease N-terminal domain-containing protein [uncultured Rhodoferax sp.]
MNHSNQILAIEFPTDGARARKVVTRSRARPTGKHPSWKMKRMMQWESLHERNAFHLLDVNAGVIAFQEQPAVITYRLNGGVHKHFPDILVQYQYKREFWEVKTSADASQEEVAARSRLMEQLLPRLGYSYRLALAEELAKAPRLSNAMYLLKGGRSPVPLWAWEQVRQAFVRNPAVYWGDVLDGALGGDGVRHVCRLILEGRLSIDLNKPMERSTQVTWCTTALAGEVL